MEPFRPLVDSIVLNMEDLSLFRKVLNNLLNTKVRIDGKNTLLVNALTIYTRSVVFALNNNDAKAIKFMESYEL